MSRLRITTTPARTARAFIVSEDRIVLARHVTPYGVRDIPPVKHLGVVDEQELGGQERDVRAGPCQRGGR